MQGSENSQLNLDYAQEWITFLRRRNLVLTIIWPVLLILMILSLVAAIYYYQIQQTSGAQLVSEIQKNEELSNTNQQLLTELATLEDAKSELQSQLSSLQNAREELSLQNNDSESKLNITSQMVDNLNQLVVELKNERASLIEKLEESQALLVLLKQQHEAFVTSSKQENVKAVSELNKQLESRKSGYQALANRQQDMREDMDRLSNIANSKEKQLERANKEKIELQAQLRNKENEIDTYSNRLTSLQESYSNLETKLNAIMSPISSTAAAKKSPESSGQNTDNMTNISGLEEIKKPAKTQETPKDENFDYNKIKVLP